MYYIQLEDDARGVLTEVVKVERKVLMLESDLKEAVGLKNLLTEGQARERAKLMGVKLAQFKVEKTRDGGLQSTASYTFDHIRDLRLPLYPWPTPTTGTYWQKALIAFQYADDEVREIRQLWAYTVPPKPDDAQGQGEGGKPAAGRSTPAELQKLRRLMPIFRDMLEGFQLFVRFQIGKKTDWLQSCPAHLAGRYLFRAWDGQYTLLSLTDQHLAFDEDALMIVVPWEIAGNEEALLKKLADARYVIGSRDRDLRPDRPWEIEHLDWRYTRLDGVRRLYARSLPDTGASRLLPMEVPAVPPPPARPRPDRYHCQYLGLDWRLLRLGDAKQIPKDFMTPAFDDGKWEKINIHVGEAAFDEKLLLYRKRFGVPPAWKGKRVVLRFGGVRDRCIVYLNGTEIARNDGWSKAFSVDVADKVVYGDGDKNLLAVQCENLTDKGGIWGEVDIGDLRFTSEFHLTRGETLAEETPAQKALRAELPGLPGVIAFQMHKPGEPEMKENWDIYTMKPDGSRLKAVVAHPAADVYPKISPDGKSILFLSLRDHWDEVLKMRKVPRSVWEDLGVFYTVDIEGKTPPRRLWPAKGLGSDACWAPDGTAIAFAQHSPPRINILPLGSTGLGGTGVPPVAPLISHTPPEVAEPATPCFAPDGRRLFFISLDDAEVEDRWGSGRVALLDPRTWQLVDKQWDHYLRGPVRGLAISPDGEQTAANTSHPHPGIRWEQFRWSWLRDSISQPEGRRGDDHLVKADLGFAETRMLPHWRSEMPERRMYNECPVWAPNSKYILFVRGPDYHEAAYLQFVRQFVLVDWMDLYLADPGGRRAVRLTWLRSRMGYPDWWAPR